MIYLSSNTKIIRINTKIRGRTKQFDDEFKLAMTKTMKTKLLLLSNRRGMSISELIRDAIDNDFKEWGVV